MMKHIFLLSFLQLVVSDLATEFDHCASCHGLNATCQIISGIFTQAQLPPGYNQITQIPRGACFLNITGLKASYNHIALRRATDNIYFLNGYWNINHTGNFEALQTRFYYTKGDPDSIPEGITARGPLSEPVDIMLFTQNLNSGIKYEYMIPVSHPEFKKFSKIERPQEDETLPQRPYLPQPSGSFNSLGSSGSLQQNFGIQPEPYTPPHGSKPNVIPVMPIPSGQNPDHIGQDGRTNQGSRRHRPRIPGDDPNVLDPRHHPSRHGRVRSGRGFVWKHVGISDCSRNCGGGVQTGLFACFKESSGVQVQDHKCKDLEKPVVEQIRCNTKPCPPEWTASDWTPCSATCGEGTQAREVACKQQLSPTLSITVSEADCVTISPQAVRSCFMPGCSRWITAAWGNCSTDCGRGFRHRLTQCVDASGEVVPENLCIEAEKPLGREVCDMGSCVTNTWFATEWTGKCADECGTGSQNREVICVGEEAVCDVTKKPETRRRCPASRECTGKWFSGPWTECSTTCEEGVQTREVVCLAFLRGQYKMALDMQCSTKTKPESKQICNVGPCESQWYTTQWTECSASCDIGVQRREIKCIDVQKTPSLGCKEDLRPMIRQSCNIRDCGDFLHSNSTEIPGENGSLETKTDSPADTREVTSERTRRKRPPPKDTEQNEDPNIDISSQGTCTDKFRNCHLVVQARLCKYKYYKTSCCASCNKSNKS